MPSAFVVTNLVDTATLSASNAVVGGPPSNLREEHIGKKWRDNAASTFVGADLGSTKSIDTYSLLGLAAGGITTGTFRLRLSTVSLGGVDVFDSGTLTLANNYDANYGTFGYLDTTPRNARYVQIDLAFPTAPYIESGRWVIGLRQEVGVGYQAPWQRSANRNSVNTIGVGGQTFIDRRSGFWLVNVQFGFLTDAERTALLETIGIAIVNSGHKDFLFVNDTATTTISRDFVWGYIDGEMQITQNLYVIPPFYGVQLPVRQRL